MSSEPGAGQIVVTTAAFTSAYSADLIRGPYRINIRDIEGAFRGFADSDANFSFYDDGRLKSINQSTTGQGEAIIKSAASLATTVAPFAGFLATKKGGAETPSDECKTVAKWGGGTKPVSLNYNLNNFDLRGALGSSLPISIAPGNEALYSELNKNHKLPLPEVTVSRPSQIGGRATYFPSNGSNGEFVYLTLQQTASVKVDVKFKDSVIWSGNVTVPQVGIYDLPIPKAALFGTQKFSLTLSEAGAITAVEYGKNAGAAGALNAAGAAAAALAPETTAAKAADVKAQADLIAQQERLVRCRTNPSQCT